MPHLKKYVTYCIWVPLLTFASPCCAIQMLRMKLMIVKGMCMMAVSNTDAVVLMGSRTILVPALVLVLQEESSKIWGIHAYSTPVEEWFVSNPILMSYMSLTGYSALWHSCIRAFHYYTSSSSLSRRLIPRPHRLLFLPDLPPTLHLNVTVFALLRLTRTRLSVSTLSRFCNRPVR